MSGMANLFDYLGWRGDLALASDPLNEVDAMILARLSYAPFEALPARMLRDPLPLCEAAETFGMLVGIDERFRLPGDRELLDALARSPRFRDLRVSRHEHLVDADTQTQFSATTVQLGDGARYVSFRGTDDTLVGWKENFNMSFLCPVPAQERAVAYLEAEAQAGAEDLVLGGHSKGGNLAMYAAAFCGQKTQARVRAVYSFDGPGFDEKIISQPSYQQVLERMTSFVPQLSIVGMLLAHRERCVVVRSSGQAFYDQHDVYSWEIMRNRLVRLEGVSGESRLVDQTLKRWLLGMDRDQREKIIDALYAILEKTNARTLQDIADKWPSCSVSILSSLGGMDDQTRELIGEALSLLAKSARRTLEEAGEQWVASK